jgi:hypothetical protein
LTLAPKRKMTETSAPGLTAAAGCSGMTFRTGERKGAAGALAGDLDALGDHPAVRASRAASSVDASRRCSMGLGRHHARADWLRTRVCKVPAWRTFTMTADPLASRPQVLPPGQDPPVAIRRWRLPSLGQLGPRLASAGLHVHEPEQQTLCERLVRGGLPIRAPLPQHPTRIGPGPTPRCPTCSPPSPITPSTT